MSALLEKRFFSFLKPYARPQLFALLFLGFSAGIPLLLIFSSLSLWLREAGVDRSTTTYFSWAALGYSFKFVWAPLIDKLPVPLLTSLLGRRRAWLLIAQLAVMASIIWMAQIDPSTGSDSLILMGVAAVCLGFSSATQDIVIDAYRIESADGDLQSLLSSMYVAGYRLAMIVSGAGALFLAEYLGSNEALYNYSAWHWTYLAMSAVMGVGVVTTLFISEPRQGQRSLSNYSASDHFGLLILFFLVVCGFVLSYYYSSDIAASAKDAVFVFLQNKPLSAVIIEAFRLLIATAISASLAMLGVTLGLFDRRVVFDSYISPVKNFFDRFGVKFALTMLALIGLYRISDIVLGVISNVFYQDIGFSKTEIAAAVKTFGLLMTLLGGFLGGVLSVRYGTLKILFAGALMSAVTNLLFIVLAQVGNEMYLFYLVVSADNISAGLASAAFIAFLSSLTNISFTAMQYAIFSSIMTLFPKIIGGYSGGMVESVGYTSFFLITTLLGVPVLLLIWFSWSRIEYYLHQDVTE